MDNSLNQELNDQINDNLIGEYYRSHYMIILKYFKYNIPRNASPILRKDMELRRSIMTSNTSIAIQMARDSNRVFEMRSLQSDIDNLIHTIPIKLK
jgi:hypothetical protein